MAISKLEFREKIEDFIIKFNYYRRGKVRNIIRFKTFANCCRGYVYYIGKYRRGKYIYGEWLGYHPELNSSLVVLPCRPGEKSQLVDKMLLKQINSKI